MAAVNYGTVAIVPKGEYSGETQYNVGNLVSYSGSSYVAKMIPPVGTLPTDTSYWQLSAQGGGTATENDLGVVKPDNTTIGIEEDGTLKSILTSALLPSTDTSGLLGQANATVNTQALIDAIADKIMTKLVTDDALTTRLANYVAKSMMTGVQVNSSNKVPTSALAYAMNELITGLRADVDSLNSDFSYDEVQVGTWVDGKPLYRKVILETINSTSNDLVFNIASDVRMISPRSSISIGDSSGYVYTSSVYQGPTSMCLLGFRKESGIGKVFLARTGGFLNYTTLCVVLEYTKST